MKEDTNLKKIEQLKAKEAAFILQIEICKKAIGAVTDLYFICKERVEMEILNEIIESITSILTHLQSRLLDVTIEKKIYFKT
jgi:hypothetical protein